MLCIAIYLNLIHLEIYTRLANYIKETRGNGCIIDHLGGNGCIIDHLGGNGWIIDHLGGNGGEKVKNPCFRVWCVKVWNVKICKEFPAGSSSYV